MIVGVFDVIWREAAQAWGAEARDLPAPVGNGDVNARRTSGAACAAELVPLDLLLDHGGAGLGFIDGPAGPGNLRLAHECGGKLLVSHLTDLVTTHFAAVPMEILWPCLQSPLWIKAVSDEAHALELASLGVPGVVHLPPAAPTWAIDESPPDPAACASVVTYVGPSAIPPACDGAPPTWNDWQPSLTALTARLALPGMTFFNAVHELYGLLEPIAPADDAPTRTRKAVTYLRARARFGALLAMQSINRFVYLLRTKAPGVFRLYGHGWPVPAAEPPTGDGARRLIRTSAINLALSGTAASGLTQRHFEITAAGGFLLCNDQPEVHANFEVGRECAVFHNELELLEQIAYYLKHVEERAAIARAGQQRTLAQHLYRHRLDTILKAARARGWKPLPVHYSSSRCVDDLRAVVPALDVVIDCGANVGQMAATLRELYPRAEIYSFEPVASVFEQLRQRCAELNVIPVASAVADFNGQTTIHLTASPEANSLLGFQEGNPCERWTRVVGTQTVPVCTLDRWCAERGIDPQRVSLIKLDIQGGELNALRGAEKLLERTRAVYLEVSFVPIYKDCPLFDEVEQFMLQHGYRRHALYPSDQPHNWGDALYVKV